MSDIDLTFLLRIRDAVSNMRRAGMDDDLIGWAIYDIRAAALQAERLRLEFIHQKNPPSFSTTGFEIAELLYKEEIQS